VESGAGKLLMRREIVAWEWELFAGRKFKKSILPPTARRGEMVLADFAIIFTLVSAVNVANDRA
jgi:hypothetical protein